MLTTCPTRESNCPLRNHALTFEQVLHLLLGHDALPHHPSVISRPNSLLYNQTKPNLRLNSLHRLLIRLGNPARLLGQLRHLGNLVRICGG